MGALFAAFSVTLDLYDTSTLVLLPQSLLFNIASLNIVSTMPLKFQFPIPVNFSLDFVDVFFAIFVLTLSKY